MLNKLRNFSKGKLAGVLVGIIIIPFVFWGMGSVFSGGNTNSIAKINSHNVSTQDFADFVNNSKISTEVIRENINNNILEQLLAQLISTSLVDLEINDLKIFISDEILAKKIKKQKQFQDENNNFSRTKYEKFLLESNTRPVEFEQNIKNNELKKKLFTYIGGGIKSPFFLINKNFKDQYKRIEVDYLDLNLIYKNKNDFSLVDLKEHINKNEEKFLVEKIDIILVKLTPENLSGDNEYSENFFAVIDEIEDLITNNIGINEIAKKYNLKAEIFNEYYPKKNDENLLDEIYKLRKSTNISLIDKNDYFLLYEVKNMKKILPSVENNEFLKTVRNDLFENEKYNTHKDIINKIQDNKFNNDDFSKLSNGNIESLKINSLNDTSKFTKDSVNLIYSLGINNYSLVSDENSNVYLVKIKNINEKSLARNNQDNKIFANQTNINLRDNLYNSYDLLLNEKYKININQKTLDRTKNFFK